MDNSQVLITHPYALLAVMMLIPVFFLYLEQWTRWKLWDYFPPIIWIFVVPIILSNVKIIPIESNTYNTFKAFAVPMFIISAPPAAKAGKLANHRFAPVRNWELPVSRRCVVRYKR